MNNIFNNLMLTVLTVGLFARVIGVNCYDLAYVIWLITIWLMYMINNIWLMWEVNFGLCKIKNLFWLMNELAYE